MYIDKQQKKIVRIENFGGGGIDTEVYYWKKM